MKTKIIVITSQYLYEFVREALSEERTDCDLQIVEYENFYHAAEIYREYEEQADGFMISGSSARTAIVKAVPECKKPIVPFEASAVSEYRIFLEEFIKNRQLDARKVIIDSMIPIYADASLDHFLFRTPPFQNKEVIMKWLESITLEEISNIETTIGERLVDLREAGKADLVICHYGSIIPVLEEHGIPYRYSGSTEAYIHSLLETLLSQIEQKRLHENLTGVIAVAAYDENGQAVPGERMKEVLFHIKNEFALDIVLHEEEGYYYIFTTRRVIEHLTDGFHQCSIRFALKKQYNIEAYVGYGIGYNITVAKGKSRDALKEAVFSKGCFVVDEQDNMLGPLDAGNYLDVRVDVSDEVFKTADRCKLSSITIQKLLSIVEMTGTNRITQQNLAEHLGVTARNASRILGNLVKGGAASIVYTKSVTSKGRPVKVYELNLK